MTATLIPTTALLALGLALATANGALVSAPDEALLSEVAAGRQTAARLDWWGFDDENSTAIMQQAVTSGVRKLIIPRKQTPWIVEPIKLGSNIEIEVEPDAVVEALRGSFKGKNDALFDAAGQSNIVFRGGSGATFRMHKKDYQNPDLYQRAEWRHVICFRSCENVHVEGLTLQSSGGDGLYFGRVPRHPLPWCKNVVVKDCLIDDNHRQGISVICATNMLIEGCVIQNTSGTAPGAGIDFEGHPFQDVTVRSCRFENNVHGVIIMTWHITPETPFSMSIEDCIAVSNRLSGFAATFGTYDPPLDLVKCSMTNTTVITRRGEVRRYDNFWRDLAQMQPLSPAEADQVQRIPRWDVVAQPVRPLRAGEIELPAPPEGVRRLRGLPGIRGKSTWGFHAREGEEVAFKVTLRVIGQGETKMPVRLLDPNGQELKLLGGKFVGRQPETFTVKVPATGTYLIELDPGSSVAGAVGVEVEPDEFALHDPAAAKQVVLVADHQAFHFMSAQGLFYFAVPAGVKEFYVLAAGSGNERVKVTLYDGSGKLVKLIDDVSLAQRIFVTREDVTQNEIWMVETSRATNFGIEDYYLDLFGIPPILAATPEGVMLP